jgi:hypothetical protein
MLNAPLDFVVACGEHLVENGGGQLRQVTPLCLDRHYIFWAQELFLPLATLATPYLHLVVVCACACARFRLKQRQLEGQEVLAAEAAQHEYAYPHQEDEHDHRPPNHLSFDLVCTTMATTSGPT